MCTIPQALSLFLSRRGWRARLTQGVNIPRGRRPSGIYTPKVVINTLFNEEYAIIVLLYRIGLITVVLAVE